MSTRDVREKYLDFYKENGHKEIDASPLVLENDPTTLFTSSGMQPLIPYLKGQKHQKGKRLVDAQPSLRMADLEEVGDNRHTTFFEMLGNWSLGDYFKAEQLPWIWEYFTKKLNLDPKKLYVSVFEGTGDVPKDDESYKIWKKLGLSDEKIHFYGVDHNWWSRSGVPSEMPVGEIGGPDSKVFYEFNIAHNPIYGKFCHPNCGCGKFLEIGNSVFMQYEKKSDGSLVELPQKNVDFGGGLERISAAVGDNPDIFQIDLFSGLIGEIEKEAGINYGANGSSDKSFRIIADHLRGACSLIAEGVIPGNKLHGYALRRLIRRAMFHFHLLGSGISGGAVAHVSESLRNHYPIIDKNWQIVEENLTSEAVKFESALKRGLSKLTRAVSGGLKIDGEFAFDLYQSDGFPLELTVEILSQNGMVFTPKEKNAFTSEFEKHKELSRTTSAGMFGGGLAEKGKDVIKLHTTTHLLHESLRRVLGTHVSQKGSHITNERLRFDFSHPGKLTAEEISKVEKMVNSQINKGLKVSFKEMSLPEAIAQGALHFFAEKYGKKVKVYSIGEFSKEVCGGPHVTNTQEIGRVKIIKQENIGSGTIRIYASNK